MTSAYSTLLFEQLPIVGILRGVPADRLAPIVAASRAGGLTNLEITMNTPAAEEQIQAVCRLAGGELNIGAGTVTDLRLLDAALSAGASFIVTPAISTEVIERCVQLEVPIFPGAFSPTEIARAEALGATMVKLFPADKVGPDYLRAVKSSLPKVKLMPTGGVDLFTFESYFNAGADGYGIGSPLFQPNRIAGQDWNWLRDRCRSFSELYRKLQSSR